MISRHDFWAIPRDASSFYKAILPPLRVGLVISALTCIFFAAVFAYSGCLFSLRVVETSRSILKLDGDQQWLFHNLRQIHTFPQTFYWWTHVWPGAFHYWRPLTAHIDWLERYYFTEDRYDLWSIVSVISQLLVDAALILFVRALGRPWLECLMAGIFFSGAAHLFAPIYSYSFWAPDYQMSGLVVSQNWKDQPDLWLDASLLGALTAVLKKKWGWALLLSAMAPCFKENGWAVFPVAFFLLAVRKELKFVPLWVWLATIGVVGVLMIFRSLTGLNFLHIDNVGHNINWWVRYHNAVCGPFFLFSWSLLVFPAMIAAGLGMAAVIFKMRPAVCLLLPLSCWILGSALAAHFYNADFVSCMFAFLVDSTRIINFITAIIWLFGVILLVKNRALWPTSIILICGWLLSASTLAIGLAVGTHVIFTANSFYCALCGIACGQMAVYMKSICCRQMTLG